jgi:hypothetical protein
MSKKLKAKSNTLAELHFVSSLPLERAVQAVGNLATDKRIVTLTEINADTFGMEIQQSEHETSQRTVNLKGQLQRWQGTETRIDCDAFVGADKRRFLTILLIVFILLVIPFIADYTTKRCDIANISSCVIRRTDVILTRVSNEIGYIIGFLGMVLGMAFLVAWGASQHTTKSTDKARAQLIEVVMKQFQAVGDVTWVDHH